MKKSRKLVNLTPHDVVIMAGCTRDDVGTQVIVPRSNSVVRVLFERVVVDVVVVNGINVDVTTSIRKGVSNLPAPNDDTYYIVSRMVAEACPDRRDLLVPDKVTLGYCKAFSLIGHDYEGMAYDKEGNYEDVARAS